MDVYQIVMQYDLCNETFSFSVFVRVKESECLSEVVKSEKEKIFYDWDEAPPIKAVIYKKI